MGRVNTLPFTGYLYTQIGFLCLFVSFFFFFFKKEDCENSKGIFWNHCFSLAWMWPMAFSSVALTIPTETSKTRRDGTPTTRTWGEGKAGNEQEDHSHKGSRQSSWGDLCSVLAFLKGLRDMARKTIFCYSLNAHVETVPAIKHRWICTDVSHWVWTGPAHLLLQFLAVHS